MTFEQHHVEHYRRHGYVVVEDFLTPAELDGARDELAELIPGWVEFCDDPARGKPENWNKRGPGRRGYLNFPFRGATLNAITLHPELRRFAAQMIGDDNLFCEQSDLHIKCHGHPQDTDQIMHCDFVNHTLAYPPPDPEYWQTAYLVYYTDVDADHAPTAICSWEHYPERIRWPAHYTREERPAIYDNEVRVTVPAGSVLAYSMRTFHRGTPFRADRRAHRPVHHLRAGGLEVARHHRLVLRGHPPRVSELDRTGHAGRADHLRFSAAGASVLDGGDAVRRGRALSGDGHGAVSATAATSGHQTRITRAACAPRQRCGPACGSSKAEESRRARLASGSVLQAAGPTGTSTMYRTITLRRPGTHHRNLPGRPTEPRVGPTGTAERRDSTRAPVTVTISTAGPARQV